MKTPHILLAAGNSRKLKNNLINVVDSAAISAIEAEICANVAQLYILGKHHCSFALRHNNRWWRQKISRLYYGAYNVSRAVRLCESGEFFEDSTDHKKIGNLPDGFPNQALYKNRLNSLRDDRNLCDYDHTAHLADLAVGIEDSIELVANFLQDARAYLKPRGVTI
jgi:hypothetical protein